MDLISNIFYRKKVDKEALIKYGFTLYKDIYAYETDIMDQTFKIKVIYDNSIKAKIYDKDSGDEYNLIYLDRGGGEYIAKVRTAYQNVLKDIADKCFKNALFNSEQANRIADYIAITYGEKPDFPWPKFDGYGVFRNSSNNLWFGLIMEVGDNKLALNVAKKTVINIKPPKQFFNELLLVDGIYPGWHMNKKSWLSISLDDTFPDEYVESLIDGSYLETTRITKSKPSPTKKNNKQKLSM